MGEQAAACVEERQESGASASTSIHYVQYKDEDDLTIIMDLVDKELSEPYSIFTYRYFLHNWPHLCFFAYDGDTPFGTVVCKMDSHRGQAMRGYVAMLVVDKAYRGKRVGSELVKMAIREMIKGGCDEVVLEAEVVNTGALKLYQGLGFVRDKRLHRYYLNGVDAYRLKLLLPLSEEKLAELAAQAEALELEGVAPGDSLGGGVVEL
ncbi:N-alpha-acetyltransferase 30 [Tetrabaena socialis]|uniref:N-alpha-acetyltransferase 30 n=1 Tax=Tetrabaena socialis TaxID=47790 RepID=A0A2J7ZVA4_9CHLO|nr:N-alpha-acetyltransferase 30 [Tetrabaena socialis]|eukprot:PNH04206.1 N-alpha-acetyltransferase 30 [Tetrabaena socialis]